VRATGVAGTPSSFGEVASPQTLERLEFARALDLVAQRAAGPLGAARIRQRRPTADRTTVERELARVSELARLLAAADPIRPDPVGDIGDALRRVAVPGSVLDGIELLQVGLALEAARALRSHLDRVAATAPTLAALVADLPPASLGHDITRSFDSEGQVKDGADHAVDAARAAVRDARTRLVSALEAVLKRLDSGETPEGASVTVRDGRYVIPVARTAKGRVRGIVHGESASGATLFVEPSNAVELGNALAGAEAREARAVLAVYRRCSDALRDCVALAAAGWEMCVAVDDVYGRARYADEVDAAPPTIGSVPGPHVLINARHPLLFAEMPDAVPFTLELAEDETAVIVSGPNTGGKTVLLKTVGLASALIQAGILPPLGAGCVIPVCRRIFADIGDHQSIAASLSTFSAHVATMRDTLEAAGPGTLVLLDEVGSGTDPAEGAALAGAAIESLVRRGCRVLATTHLSALKRLAAETPGVLNASLQFDPDTLTPTYRFLKGVPGRSYGLVIARRLGLPSAVLDDAESRAPDPERTLDAALADLERRTADLAARELETAAMATRLDERHAEIVRAGDDLRTREAEANAREKELEREGRERARQFLLDARKRVEEALGMARAAVTEATAKEARRLVEAGISDEAEELQRLQEVLARKGWTVRSGAASRPRPPAGPAAPGTKDKAPLVQPSARPPIEVDASPEIDVRGMTVDEACDAVTRALDAAVLADLPVLRIIHGKGTGRLRAAVGALVAADRRIGTHRLAPPIEGGTGVTIAELES